MSTITLPNIRVSSDLTIRLKLKDGGVAIDWSTLQNIRVSLYADDQRSMASRCNVSIDEEDSTILVCQYAANKMQYLGVNRVIVQCKYLGEVKTYDKPAFTFVRWTSDQEGEQITIDDPDVDVEISVEDVSSSILQEAVDAAFDAADRANDAAAAAEHMVDIHTGPEGKSAYEVAVEEGYTGTEEEWLASLKGPVGETPDISIGTVTTVEPGIPAAASMSGTPEAPVLNLSIPKGLVGATPNFTVGTVTTGEPGSSVIVTITGTPEAPVLNLTIPQGMQGNTGSSVEYPYELVNNLTTNDATKGLSAAQGYVLDGKVSQLEAELIVGEVVNLDLTATRNLRPTSGGTINTGNNGYSYIAEVKSGDVLTINFSIPTSGNYLRYGFTNVYPAGGVAISGYGEKNYTVHQVVVTAPANGYLLMECQIDFTSITVTKPQGDNAIGKIVYDLEGGLNSVLNSVYETKAIGNSTVGLLKASDGTIDASLTTRRTSDFIPFENDIKLFNAFQATNSSYATACVYDSQKGFVSSIVLDSGTVDLTVKKADYPTGAYIRYSLSSSSEECKAWMALPIKDAIDGLEEIKPNVDFLVRSSYLVLDVGMDTIGLPLYADGTIDSSLSTRRTSDYIPFDADIILYNAFQPTNAIYAQVVIYDANKAFVTALNGTSGTSSDVSLKKSDYPSGAFVRFGLISSSVECRVKRAVAPSEIASKVVFSENYGKKIAIFGGSFASSQSGYFTESALDVWREKLGLEIDNYAVGGAGFTPSASSTITSQVDTACAEDKDPYDIYLLWGSGNDFSAQVAVGVQSDYTQADNYDVQKLNTQAGGINYCVKKILEKAPTAKICFFTSLRYLNQERGWNPFFSGSGIPMVDYVDGQKACCERWGIPCLDQFREIAWNPYNADEMTGSDGVHPSATGYEYIAQRQISFLAKL